ncbi:MAG: DUF4338 domain-containing protein [Bryobacterales bacterium]|nr:DUF4338 domain-containing protein [Bryobacterales bacterium]
MSLNVIADLVAQGWRLHIDDASTTLTYDANGDVAGTKATVRRRHLVERDSQLREPAVATFIRGMEQKRLTATGWHSIFSVMRDGKELAARLTAAVTIADPAQRLSELSKTIDPYLQFVEPGARCEHTGLPLMDIWRYFRHTWTTAYRSVPGRSINILVRDAAAAHHPVIGIAALGSAVVQQRVRDKWIGWDAEQGLELLLKNPSAATAAWLQEQVGERVSNTYKKDLVEEGIVTRKELTSPTESTIERLHAEADTAIQQHRQHPQKNLHKSLSKTGKLTARAWEERARSHLFRAKRCALLSRLLSIRRVFRAQFADTSKEALAAAFESRALRNSVAQLLRIIKAERVGICMMDITVCGAIAPYNSLLGGKLVSVLLCSPEITQYYAVRYGQQQSLIASSMAGKGIVRRPTLVLLGTTSLYGTGASQYNRIKLPAGDFGGQSGNLLEYKALGYSVGYGSFHFSSNTVAIIETLLARTNGGRKVNSIFGEGVNPLMRKIREGLDAIGLPSDQLLQHGNRRIVYGIGLARNFRQVLLGMHRRPQFLLPQQHPEQVTAEIAAYWRRRWLNGRIVRPGILPAVAGNTLDCPVRHGAQVCLPDAPPLPLFADLAE